MFPLNLELHRSFWAYSELIKSESESTLLAKIACPNVEFNLTFKYYIHGDKAMVKIKYICMGKKDVANTWTTVKHVKVGAA